MTHEVFDPSGLAFEDWLRCFFDRPIVPFGLTSEAWYDDLLLSGIQDRERLLRYVERFNSEFAAIKGTFSPEQIDQGLWVLFGSGIQVGALLASDGIPSQLKLSFIDSVESLYRQAFDGCEGDIDAIDAGGAFFMLWDLILFHMWIKCERHRPADMDAVLDRCANALQSILALNHRACDKCVLHGLGHLKTPRAKEIIRRYLESRPHLTAEERMYAENCYDGKA